MMDFATHNTDLHWYRLIIVDDNPKIHNDIAQLLIPDTLPNSNALDDFEKSLFNQTQSKVTFASQFTIDSAYQGQAALAKVKAAVEEKRPYSLALVDIRMPLGWDGVETIEALWREDPDLQIIICSAHSDYSWIQIVRQLGLNDRLLVLKKPFEAIELVQMVHAMCEKWRLQLLARRQLFNLEKTINTRTQALHHQTREREQAEATARYLVDYDPKTACLNRATVICRLEKAVVEAKQQQHCLALLALDLDGFAQVNARVGFGAGDQVLQIIAQRISAALRRTDRSQKTDLLDQVGRTGGDEFLILVTHINNEEEASRVAQRVIDEVAKPISIDGLSLSVSACAGIAIYPEHGAITEQLIENAETALTNAKLSGSKCYRIFDADQARQAKRIWLLGEALNSVLDNDQLSLHYQPQVNLAWDTIVGVEALLRWKHPVYGSVSPVEFIPIVERTGQIVPIGGWVLKHACAQASAWHRQGLRGLRVAVNLSAMQFRSLDLVETVATAIAETNLDSTCLELELTESMLIENVEAAIETMHALKALGVQLAIDDFGTGYSSLCYLKRFPIDRVKLDRSFVQDIDSDAADASIAQAVVSLTHRLGLKVIAEGVETETQRALLAAEKCDEIQGYLLSKPLPRDEITLWLQTQCGPQKRVV